MLFQDELRKGYALALETFPLRDAPDPVVRFPAGMLEALGIAATCRPASLDALLTHYTRAMPAMLAAQLRRAGGPEERLFSTRLDLSRMPRLGAALHALEALVGPVPRGTTLGELYAQCHYGGCMPMLYAYPGDLAALPPGDLTAYVDRRLVGPLIHELSHLDGGELPQPQHLHEVLAAYIGSEAWPSQIDASEDALPGGAFLASAGAWLAREVGDEQAIRIQRGEAALEPRLAAALRCYGFLPFLETCAPHLLIDAFHPGRWWKLIDLHRDSALTARLHRELVEPLLAGGPASVAQWDAWLDALPWSMLPAWNEPPREADHRLALRAERALRTRAVRHGLSFRNVHVECALTLDRARSELHSGLPPDAVGAPGVHPYPPSLSARG